MNSKQIELVLDLAATLNFRKTAENKFISQPALTHQIKALEEETGVTIFLRSPQGVSLTPAGRYLCQQLQHLQNAAEHAVATARNLSDQYSDTLVLGHNPRRMTNQISRVLSSFEKMHPEVRVQIKEVAGHDRLGAFLRGEIDMLLSSTNILPTNLNIHSDLLYRSQLFCVVRKDDPLTAKSIIYPEDLKDHRVQLCTTNKIRFLQHAQAELCEKVHIYGFESTSLDESLLRIRASGSAAVIPGYCYAADPDLSWIPYSFDETASFCLTWHPEDSRIFITDFANLMMQVFHKDAEAHTIY